MKIIVKNKINEVLTELKLKHGVDKVDVANRMGISRQGLNIIANTPNPSIKKLIHVAEAIGCKVEDLYEYAVDLDDNKD